MLHLFLKFKRKRFLFYAYFSSKRKRFHILGLPLIYSERIGYWAICKGGRAIFSKKFIFKWREIGITGKSFQQMRKVKGLTIV
jgi:hypothetical protein